MDDFSFFMPVRVIFGAGVSKQVGEVTRPLGERVLVVTGKSAMRRLGVLDAVCDSLKAAGCEAEIHEGIQPNPTTAQVMAGAAHARDSGAAAIVAVGGGSSIDAAKGIAVAATNAGDIWEYVKKSADDPRPVEIDPLPLVTIPSTAGTGSETTPFAVLTNPETKEKPALMHPKCFARVSLIDPEVSSMQPAKVTAATGLDVFAHVFENYTCTTASPVAEPIDLDVMSTVAKWLPKVYTDGADGGCMEGRSRMAVGSFMAGICLAAGGGAQMIHGLEHPVSGHFDVTHGEGLAALLPASARHFLGAIPGKAANIARAMGREASASDGVEECLAAIDELLAAIDLNVGLGSLGVDESALETLTDDAMRTMGRAVVKAPVETTADDVLRVYREAM